MDRKTAETTGRRSEKISGALLRILAGRSLVAPLVLGGLLSFPPSVLAGAGVLPENLPGSPPGPSSGSSPVVADSDPPLPGEVAPGASPAVPPSSTSSPPVVREWFLHGKRLTVDARHPRRAVLGYVARRVYSRPDPLLGAKIAQASRRILADKSWRLSGETVRVKDHPALRTVLTKKDLNLLADRLDREVTRAAGPSTIRRVILSGVRPRDTGFVAKNLGVAPGNSLPEAGGSALPDTLYALSQLPGYSRADALLVPGTLPGQTDLVVRATPTDTLSGSQIEVDNYGYAAMGQVTVNGTLNVNDTLFTGDQTTVSASGTPFGTIFFGMASGTLAYSAPIDLENRLGLDMNVMEYQIGGGWSPWGHGATVAQLVALGLSGDNYAFDGWGSHTFVQSPTAHLALKGEVFLKEFTDTYSPTVQNDRSVIGGMLDLSGSRTWGAWSGSFEIADTEYGLTQGAGSSSQNPFYYDTQGIQNYWTGNGGIRYAISPVYSVYLSTVDQQYIGGGVLDPMLQAVLGGMSNVRALPTAALFGNDLYSGSLSFIRSDTVKGGALLSSLFFDAGQVTGVGFEYGAMGPGIEESWTGQHLFGKADLAVPVGPLPTEAMGSPIAALTGGNIAQGGIPLELWLSVGYRY